MSISNTISLLDFCKGRPLSAENQIEENHITINLHEDISCMLSEKNPVIQLKELARIQTIYDERLSESPLDTILYVIGIKAEAKLGQTRNALWKLNELSKYLNIKKQFPNFRTLALRNQTLAVKAFTAKAISEFAPIPRANYFISPSKKPPIITQTENRSTLFGPKAKPKLTVTLPRESRTPQNSPRSPLSPRNT